MIVKFSKNWLVYPVALLVCFLTLRCDCQDYVLNKCLRDADCPKCHLCFNWKCHKNMEICGDEEDNDCDMDFDEGCEESCAGVYCDAPPEKECADKKTLRKYFMPGVCIEGTCRYDFRDQTCEMECKNGGCTETINCGNGICDDRESVKNCPGDCRSSKWECGNGVCEPEESASVCPSDCRSAEQGCGDGTCGGDETPANCPADCPLQYETICGNGVCEAGESVTTCPNDCQTVVFFEGECKGGSNAEECILNEDADQTFNLDAEYLYGNAAVIVGDMDGDGLDDIAIGAPHSNAAGFESGAVYLIYGRREGFTSMGALGKADAIITGEGREDRFGYSLDAAGDVNADGFPDMIVGAHCASSLEHAYQGYAYLVPGGGERLSGKVYINGNLDFGQMKFMDSQMTGSAGWDVSGAGDVDADGFDDMLIGAPLRSNGTSKGAAYLVYGREDWEDLIRYNAVWLDDLECGWINDHDYQFLGRRVSDAGDTNADGYSDFLIGAPNDSTPVDPETGRVHLIYGRSERFTGIDVISSADVTFVPSTHSLIGFEIATAGDLDADGYDDMIIGEPGDYSLRTVSYVFYGNSEKLIGEVSLQNADAIFTSRHIGQLGPAHSGVGDVNGDGFSDIAVSAAYQGKEAVFLILGGSHRFEGTLNMDNANAVFFIESSDECMGYTGSLVRGGGDVNGDGFDDFLIGAAGYCGGGGYQAYVFLVLGEGVP